MPVIVVVASIKHTQIMATATRVGVDVVTVVDTSTLEKKTATVLAGAAFLVGVIVGWGLRGLRQAYLKKKHEFLKRHMKKTEAKLLDS